MKRKQRKTLEVSFKNNGNLCFSFFNSRSAQQIQLNEHL